MVFTGKRNPLMLEQFRAIIVTVDAQCQIVKIDVAVGPAFP